MNPRYNFALEMFQRSRSDATALVFEGRSISYGTLESNAGGLAGEIAGKLNASGETRRIGLLSSDSADYVRLALGIMLAGACFIPVPREMPVYERNDLIEATGAEAIIVSDVSADFGAEWERTEIMSPALDRAACMFVRRGSRTAPGDPQFSALNPVFVRFTSGTTGQSKGVVLSHQTLRDRVMQANRALEILPDDRVIWILPMAYHFAASIMLYLWQGAATIICPAHLASSVLGRAVQDKASVIYASPFHYRLLAVAEPSMSWPGLRLAVSTASALDRLTAEAFLARFGIPLTQALGIIEAGIPCINRAARENPEAVGCVVDGFEAKIDAEPGVKNGPLEGELLLRGPGLFDAYLNPWKTREEIMPDGWFRTGDFARIGSGGGITLLGRRKSVINVGGMKCFPEEIEAVLAKHPAVSASRVTGKSHAKFGQVPVAEIVAASHKLSVQSGELMGFCRRFLSSYKVPIEFKMVDFIPTTSNGKVKR